MQSTFGHWAGAALLALTLSTGPVLARQEAQDAAGYEERLARSEHHDGLFDLYTDRQEGAVLAAFPASDTNILGRYIYTARLTAGLGSNPVGLDRGFGIQARILRVERAGNRLLFILEKPVFSPWAPGLTRPWRRCSPLPNR